MTKRIEHMYGLFPGGDPRKFQPDEECCTPEELAAHAAACLDWDKGAGIDRGPSCATYGDGSAWSGTGFGIGVYEYEEDDDECPDCGGEGQPFEGCDVCGRIMLTVSS